MESKDIIKALENCKRGKCENCPFKADCLGLMSSNALELIKNQQAEIERLQNILDEKVIEFAYNKKQEIKTEAYKEFVDKLCEDRVSNDNTVILAKCLLKELTEKGRLK